MAVRVVTWVGRIAGAGAMLLGWLFLVFHLDILSVHIALGVTLALSLVLLGLVMLGQPRTRFLGAAGVGYALFVAAFGLAQTWLLVGQLHWLIQLAHLLLGFGAVVLVQVMSARYSRLAGAARAVMPQDGAVQIIQYP